MYAYMYEQTIFFFKFEWWAHCEISFWLWLLQWHGKWRSYFACDCCNDMENDGHILPDHLAWRAVWK